MRIFQPLALLLLCLVAPALNVGAAEIVGVEVENLGDTLLDEVSVLSLVGTRPGDTFDPTSISADVRELQATGGFSYVGVERRKVDKDYIIVFRVVPKPRIASLQVLGGDKFSNRKIAKLLDLDIGDMVDDVVLAERAQKVRAEYAKKYYPNAQVDWAIDNIPGTGRADVTVTVTEGVRSKVRDIDFEGLTKEEAEVAREAMRQKETNWLSLFTKDGKFDPGEIEFDRHRVRRTLLDKGLLDAEVGEPEIVEVSPKKVDLVFPVTKGQEYLVRDVSITGNDLFGADQLALVLRIHGGDVASLSAVEASVDALQDYYGGRGYLRTSVDRSIRADPAARVVDVEFVVREGRLARIHDINIRGNTHTKDKVIRRELTVYPGTDYDTVRIRQSKGRLMGLGFFSYVEAFTEKTPDPDIYDLVFEVEEQRSGQMVMGVGFSSIDEITGFAEISQGNFDMLGFLGPLVGKRFSPRGAGQKIRFRLSLGTARRDLILSFTEPWFLNRRLRLGADIFQNESQYYSDDYDQLNTGGRLSLMRPIFGPYRVKGTYSLQEIEVSDVDEDASELIKAEEGATIKSEVIGQLIYDTRYPQFVPVRGARSVLSGHLAGGILGGETDFYKLDWNGVKYWPMYWDHIFFLRGHAGSMEPYGDSEDIRIFDRYFLGGPRNLRGFEYREVGPKDEQGEPIGGRTIGFASAEYQIPVVRSVRAAAFYDLGMVWDRSWDFDTSNYNSDYGIGLRLDLPGFPLHLDYAWPLEADEFNDSSSGRFNFLIGYQF